MIKKRKKKPQVVFNLEKRWVVGRSGEPEYSTSTPNITAVLVDLSIGCKHGGKKTLENKYPHNKTSNKRKLTEEMSMEGSEPK